MFSRSTPRRLVERLLQPRSFLLKRAPARAQARFLEASTSRWTANTTNPAPKRPDSYTGSIAFMAACGFLSLAVAIAQASPAQCDAPTRASEPDGRDPNLPRFRMSEVRKHDGKSESPWVIRGDRVYDITDWIPAHPGGEVILRAAGGSIDPYWDIFSIHKTQYVYDILSQFHIGYIDSADLVDGLPAQEQIEDPFSDDPERHPALITRTAKPRNAETPEEAMETDFLTPNELFYVRNHMWVPKVEEDPNKHTLTIELVDGETKEYTLKDLKTKFKSHKVTAVLQCSGNRRKHMSDGSGRSTNGLQWNAGAISNACWEGVLLSDLLADAGFDLSSGLMGTSEAKHVQFSGLEAYGASIPIKKAIDPQGDVLLAYSMNGKPLPRDHGFPLRSIVPGHVAARSVKWLSHITLSDEESTSQWQRRDYKCFGPNQTQVDWDKAPAIQELPVQSAITGCKLGDWTRVKSGDEKKLTERRAQEVSLTGYAYSGGGRSIIRVDVSLDGGKSWTQAEILPDCTTQDGKPSPCLGHGAWTWRRWKYSGAVPLDAFEPIEEKVNEKQRDKGDQSRKKDRRCATFVVKATDEAYNTQPESHAATWNIRGNLATAWHRLKVCSECPAIVDSVEKEAT
ncbi:Fc.00g054150.m01.CDS01 [Cosmosporella sp. VM-42]